MSVAVVIVPPEGGVTLATDTRSQIDARWIDHGPKMVERNGWMFAWVGEGIVERALRDGTVHNTDDPLAYIDGALLWLKERGALGHDGSTESVFIASDGARAWVIDGVGALCQIVDRGEYAAVGAGAGEALGALHILHPAAPTVAPHLAAMMAVNAAVRWSGACGGYAAGAQYVNGVWSTA